MKNVRPITALAALVLASTGVASDLETSARYSSRLAEYEQSGDLSWAYRLAWIAAIGERPELTARWLTVLTEGGWRMGVDPTAIDVRRLAPGGADLFTALQRQLPTRYGTSDTIASFADSELIPESIAYDTKHRRLYAGSLHQKRVVAMQSGGESQRFSTTALGAVYGIKYDEPSSTLWALHNPQLDGDYRGELVQFSDSGFPLQRVAPVGDAPRELNDLCLDDEAVFVTDSLNGRVLYAPRSTEVLRDLSENNNVPYANGIACGSNERFVFVAGATGIYRIDKNKPEEPQRLNTPNGVSLGGIDGLYLWNDKLVGIQNALGAPKVVVASMAGDAVSDVVFLDVLRPDFRLPTTGFVLGDCLYYIANSSLDALDASGSLNPQAPPPESARVRGLPLDRQASCQLDN